MIERLRAAGQKIKREVKVYQLLLRDSRTPKPAKLILGLAVGYIMLPFDIIPDFLPVIGHVDDIIIVPALVFTALKLIPKELVAECRMKVDSGVE